jgi:hypothetical protein
MLPAMSIADLKVGTMTAFHATRVRSADLPPSLMLRQTAVALAEAGQVSLWHV